METQDIFFIYFVPQLQQLIQIVAFLIFFVGFASRGVGGCANARQLSKAMSTDVPAAIRVEINQ